MQKRKWTNKNMSSDFFIYNDQITQTLINLSYAVYCLYNTLISVLQTHICNVNILWLSHIVKYVISNSLIKSTIKDCLFIW